MAPVCASFISTKVLHDVKLSSTSSFVLNLFSLTEYLSYWNSDANCCVPGRIFPQRSGPWGYFAASLGCRGTAGGAIPSHLALTCFRLRMSRDCFVFTLSQSGERIGSYYIWFWGLFVCFLKLFSIHSLPQYDTEQTGVHWTAQVRWRQITAANIIEIK